MFLDLFTTERKSQFIIFYFIRLWGVISEMVASGAYSPTHGAGRSRPFAKKLQGFGTGRPGLGRGITINLQKFRSVGNLVLKSEPNYILDLPVITRVFGKFGSDSYSGVPASIR